MPDDNLKQPPEQPRPNSWWQVFRRAYQQWQQHNAPRLGAALAYYTVFSIAPLLIIVIAIAGFFLGAEAVRGGLHSELTSLLGTDAATGIEGMVANAHQEKTAGIWATIFGLAALIFGAMGVFLQLKGALNTIWEVEVKRRGGWWGFVRDYFLSFTMVLSVAFLLLVSLVLSAALAAFNHFVGKHMPAYDVLLQILDVVLSLGVVTFLFAMIYKVLPEVPIDWRDVWLGALMTSLLFTIGKYAIGVYIGQTAVGSSYGAAGSLVIVMVWAYYSAQILFMGAEFTKAHAAYRRNQALRSSLSAAQGRRTA